MSAHQGRVKSRPTGVRIGVFARGSYPLHVIHTLSGIPFDTRFGVRQVSRTGRVAAALGARLEVTLEGVAASEGAPAQDTPVRPFPGVCDEIVKSRTRK